MTPVVDVIYKIKKRRIEGLPMDVPSDDFRKELINKLKPCIHCLTMRPGLFRGDYCDSFDRFLAGEAVSFLYVRDPGPLQDMLETDFIDVFLYGSDIRNCFYFIRNAGINVTRKGSKVLIFDKSLTKKEFLDSIYEQLKQMEDIDRFSKDEINDLVCAIGNSLIDNKSPSFKRVLGGH